MKSIFYYTDYRTFLKDYLQTKQSQNKNFSLRLWTKKLKISDPSVLAKIINGKRNIGNKLIKNFVDYFKFQPNEEEYFTQLIKLPKVKDDPTLSLALQKQIEKSHFNAKLQFLNDEEFSAICKWHYEAIREMTNLPYFKEDYKWIASQLLFQVTPKEAKEAIATLLAHGLIVRDKNGKLQSTGTCLIYKGDDIWSEALASYQEQMLQNAIGAIKTVPRSETEMLAATLNINEEQLPEFKQYINDFCKNVNKLFKSKTGTRTYQINIQLFPLISGQNNPNE